MDRITLVETHPEAGSHWTDTAPPPTARTQTPRPQRHLHPARRNALTPEQVASPLARRPYDLRHAAATLWLSGVPATEVARRLGHSVAVLLRVYANCIDGGGDANNQRIEDALDSSKSPSQSHQSRSRTA